MKQQRPRKRALLFELFAERGRFISPHPNPPPQAGEGVDTPLFLPLPPLAGEGVDTPLLLPLPPLAAEGVDTPLLLPLPPLAAEGVDTPLLLPLPPLAGEGWDGGALLDAEPEADAAVTSAPGTVLAILTADCLPVVFSAKDGSEVAATHAGWRGLANGILESTVAAMYTPAADVIAWLGPCAGPQAYEIGQEVFDAFVSREPRAATAFTATRPGHWRVDLYALARQRLTDAGIAPNNIHGGGLCTISDPSRFFSHRRDQRTGRMATLVWIA